LPAFGLRPSGTRAPDRGLWTLGCGQRGAAPMRPARPIKPTIQPNPT
jgi:hypothetical protein